MFPKQWNNSFLCWKLKFLKSFPLLVVLYIASLTLYCSLHDNVIFKFVPDFITCPWFYMLFSCVRLWYIHKSCKMPTKSQSSKSWWYCWYQIYCLEKTIQARFAYYSFSKYYYKDICTHIVHDPPADMWACVTNIHIYLYLIF